MVVQLEDVRLSPGGSAEPPLEAGQSVVSLQVDGSKSVVAVRRREPLAEPGRLQVVGGPVPSATPDRLLLGGLRHPRLRLYRPVSLTVEREDEHVTVWSDLLEEIGYGPHLTAAVEDFQETVSELYFSLKAEQERLGPEMRRLWEMLQGMVDERP